MDQTITEQTAAIGEQGDMILALVSMVAMIVLYFLPGIIAIRRKHHNDTAILVLNLLLGWTVLGWIAALIWSLTSPPPKSV